MLHANHVGPIDVKEPTPSLHGDAKAWRVHLLSSSPISSRFPPPTCATRMPSQRASVSMTSAASFNMPTAHEELKASSERLQGIGKSPVQLAWMANQRHPTVAEERRRDAEYGKKILTDTAKSAIQGFLRLVKQTADIRGNPHKMSPSTNEDEYSYVSSLLTISIAHRWNPHGSGAPFAAIGTPTSYSVLAAGSGCVSRIQMTSTWGAWNLRRSSASRTSSSTVPSVAKMRDSHSRRVRKV